MTVQYKELQKLVLMLDISFAKAFVFKLETISEASQMRANVLLDNTSLAEYAMSIVNEDTLIKVDEALMPLELFSEAELNQKVFEQATKAKQELFHIHKASVIKSVQSAPFLRRLFYLFYPSTCLTCR
jgi:hypothetical protein